MSTNIGRKIFNLLDKHFPPNHKLHPICNRNCVKVSYSCMPNMAAIIKLHNSNLTNPSKTDETKLAENCNCRNKSNCPLNGNRMKSCVVYEATISSGNKRDDYYGSCSTAFKKTLQQLQLFVSTSAPKEKYRAIKPNLGAQKQRPRLPNPMERHLKSCCISLWCKNMQSLSGRKAANH